MHLLVLKVHYYQVRIMGEGTPKRMDPMRLRMLLSSVSFDWSPFSLCPQKTFLSLEVFLSRCFLMLMNYDAENIKFTKTEINLNSVSFMLNWKCLSNSNQYYIPNIMFGGRRCLRWSLLVQELFLLLRQHTRRKWLRGDFHLSVKEGSWNI